MGHYLKPIVYFDYMYDGRSDFCGNIVGFHLFGKKKKVRLEKVMSDI